MICKIFQKKAVNILIFSCFPKASRQSRKVKKVINHSGFNPSKLTNDIALVELDQEVQFNDYVRPACVLDKYIELASGKKVIISGWGTTSPGGSQPNILQEAAVRNLFAAT